jgi:hypothetical protein
MRDPRILRSPLSGCGDIATDSVDETDRVRAAENAAAASRYWNEDSSSAPSGKFGSPGKS